MCNPDVEETRVRDILSVAAAAVVVAVEVEISRPPCPHPRKPVLLEGNGTMPMLFRSMIERRGHGRRKACHRI